MTLQEIDSIRRAKVAHRWPSGPWDIRGLSRWMGWGWQNYHHPLLAAMMISAMCLDLALWPSGKNHPTPFWPSALIIHNPAGIGFLIFLLIVNSWIIDRYLADKTLKENNSPRWLLWLRHIASSLPILGVLVIPIWREFIQRRPRWAFRACLHPPFQLIQAHQLDRLQRTRRSIRFLRRRASQSYPLVSLWLIFGQILPWLAVLSWLQAWGPASPKGRGLLICTCILVHLIACACGLHQGANHLRQLRSSGFRAVLLRYGPLLFLLPAPFFIPVLLWWLNATGELNSRTTLTKLVHDSKHALKMIKGTRGLALLTLLAKGSTGNIWRLAGRITKRLPYRTIHEDSKAFERRTYFFQIKLFLLLFDACALACVLNQIGASIPNFSSAMSTIYPFLIFPGASLLGEVALWIIAFLQGSRRLPTKDYAYGRSLALSQLSLTIGLLMGSSLARSDISAIGFAMANLGIIAFYLAWMLFLASLLLHLSSIKASSIVAWSLLYLGISIVGDVVRSNSHLTQSSLSLLGKATGLTPLWSLALFLGLGKWLLHPFQVQHLFDRRFPGKARVALAIVALTAALPLGGIAVPFWIYAHYRLWPRYEKLL